MVINTFVTNQLDYCNALYVGVGASSISRFQMVQKAAGHLLTGTSKYEYISILASLHWLPMYFRIIFKINVFAFNSKGLGHRASLSFYILIHLPTLTGQLFLRETQTTPLQLQTSGKTRFSTTGSPLLRLLLNPFFLKPTFSLWILTRRKTVGFILYLYFLPLIFTPLYYFGCVNVTFTHVFIYLSVQLFGQL